MTDPVVKVSNWNLPNALTVLRIALVPFFGWLLLAEHGSDDTLRWWAAGLFALAIATDRIDGDLARKRGLVTDFGKVTDPIADKALTGMAFVGLSVLGELPWWITIAVLVREWGITIMRFVVIRHGVMPAGRGGKTKTALWQLRPQTDDLRDIWLEKVGWAKSTADDLWERSGGDKTFPQVGGKTCQMDHIVELQIGGSNVPQNIQPLDAAQNQSSGGAIKGELQTLALAISNDSTLSSGGAQQIKLRFQDVTQVGTPEKLPASCPAKVPTRTCLAVEDCATKLKVEKSETGAVTVARADYPVTAGGRPPTNLKVPVTFATRATEIVLIETDSQNASAATLIPGLLLTNLAHRKGTTTKPDAIEARIDDRDKTRLPISIDPSAKPLHLNVATDGNLTLNPADKKGGIAFTYKYLSPGTIREIGFDESGETSWKGTIRPSIPFLGDLDIEYSKNSLVVTKGLDEATLQQRSILGMHLTKAKIQLQLAPQFRPEGVVEAQLGSGDAPIAKASLKVSADSIGLIAAGQLKVNIPKMQTAEANVSYKGGEGRDEWKTDIHIKSEDINLGSSVAVSGGFHGFIEKGDIKFAGKINATFPGDNTAELGLAKGGDGWVLFGGGTFHFPNLDPTTVSVQYFLAKDRMIDQGAYAPR